MEYEPSEDFKTKYGELKKFSYKVNMKGAANLQKIVIKQFDKGDNVIAVTTMDADSIRKQVSKSERHQLYHGRVSYRGQGGTENLRRRYYEYSHTKKDGVIVIKDITIV